MQGKLTAVFEELAQCPRVGDVPRADAYLGFELLGGIRSVQFRFAHMSSVAAKHGRYEALQ